MRLADFPRPPRDSRIGFSLADALSEDPNAQEAQLTSIADYGASWVTLRSPVDAPLGLDVLRAAVDRGLEPIIWVDAWPIRRLDPRDFAASCRSWERAGAHYVCVFDRPNVASRWAFDDWRGPGLPRRFADLIVPALETIQTNGLWPVIAPLAPAGHYWDHTFLARLLESIASRGRSAWLDRLGIAIFDVDGLPSPSPVAPADERQRFRPYDRDDFTNVRSLDVSPWYDLLAREQLGCSLPLLAVDRLRITTTPAAELEPTAEPRGRSSASRGETVPRPDSRASSESATESAAAESPREDTLREAGEAARQGALPDYRLNVCLGRNVPRLPTRTTSVGLPANAPSTPRPALEHYLLLCSSEASEGERWTLSGVVGAILPYVGRFRPTVGFRPDEAIAAARVTIVGPDSEQLQRIETTLRESGCLAEAIQAASVQELKRTMTELANRNARFARIPDWFTA